MLPFSHRVSIHVVYDNGGTSPKLGRTEATCATSAVPAGENCPDCLSGLKASGNTIHSGLARELIDAPLQDSTASPLTNIPQLSELSHPHTT